MLRRDFLKSMAASLVFFHAPNFASSTNNKPKVVWVMLRGALDSLHTVVPVSDSELVKLRPTLYPSIRKSLLPLNTHFALHPSLKNLHSWYQEKQLLPVVAVSSGFSHRSHFEGQDYLESALAESDVDNGWLNRAILAQQKSALSVSRSTPISLRGKAGNTNTWYPSNLKEASEDTFDALQKLYQYDDDLSQSLQEGLETQAMTQTEAMSNQKKGNFVTLSKACAKLLVHAEGPDCAMLSVGGWDTHNNQANRLQRQLSVLDNGLQALKTEMGKEWSNTLVIVASEFGRTAKENGTQGTDHGTAGCLFLAGGRVEGGQVLGQWPGLKNEQLFAKRDLLPTSNCFAWIAKALGQHWQLSDQQLNAIFPTVKPVTDSLSS